MAIQYLPLSCSKNEIRLLKLLPKAGGKKLNYNPACRIFHASLDDKPRYTALSYVWGNEDNMRLIFVDNSPVRVRRNLYDAMIALRHLDEPIVVWIDSLCINQSDDEEKSWQVGRMDSTYRQASQVFAWLGMPDNTSDSVMDYLNSLGSKLEACGFGTGGGEQDWLRETWRKVAFEPRAMGKMGDETSIFPRGVLNSIFYSISGWHEQDNLLPVSGIIHLFKREWWGRIWVLQEITLPENAEFICGTKRITRRRCSAALNAYCALRYIIMEKFSLDQRLLTRYHLDILRNLFQLRPTVMLSSWAIYRYARFSLAALLRATRQHGPHHMEATDPRDKIFALLGLAADRDELEELGVHPDYTKSCKEVYTSTMAALLQQGHISLLSLCQTHKRRPDLPSWVPDWSASLTHMFQDVRNDHITIYPEFSASGPTSHTPAITVMRKCQEIKGISMLGYIYDDIYEAGSFPGRISSDEVPILETFSWPVEWLVELLRLTYHNQLRYKDFKDRLRAVARTSIADVGYNKHKELERVEDGRFLDAVALIWRGNNYCKDRRIKSGIQKLVADPELKKQLPDIMLAQSRFGSEIIGKSLRRHPFITRKGHLVLGPESTKRGDSVALIKGSQVPFVLRVQGDGQYQIVGEAYVHDIMDGEIAGNSTFCDIKLV
ncbi:hypothetical protein ACMFMF_003599 [Clarireedia jacksonii]